MWIIHQNHRLYSAFAREYLDSKEALKELSGNSGVSMGGPLEENT